MNLASTETRTVVSSRLFRLALRKRGEQSGRFGKVELQTPFPSFERKLAGRPSAVRWPLSAILFAQHLAGPAHALSDESLSVEPRLAHFRNWREAFEVTVCRVIRWALRE